MFTLSNHAVPLLDADGKQRTNPHGNKLLGMGVTVKAEPIEDRIVRMVASTEDVDRMGDIIRADGWVLGAYEKNPVILWGHDHNTPAVATAKKTWVEDKKLLQDWYFSPEYSKVSPLSEQLYVAYREGVIQASSVGFSPLAYEQREPPEDAEGDPDDFYGYEFKRQELYEVSAVNVPANPEALQQLRSKGFDTEPLERMWERMEGLVIEVDDDSVEEMAERGTETEREAGGGMGSENGEASSIIDDPEKVEAEEIVLEDDSPTGEDDSPKWVKTTGVTEEGVSITFYGRTWEDVEELMIEELEDRGLLDAGEEFLLTDDEPEMEIGLEDQPAPSDEVTISEAQLASLREAVQGPFVAAKEAQRLKRAMRREINYRYGILEDEQ